MGPGEHRPYDHEYWTPPWSTALFSGDLFEAVPFGDQPTVIYAAEEGPATGKHFVGAVALGYGLLITPTCDMTDQSGARAVAHPYRTLVPVLPLALVLEQTGALDESANLLRSRDTIQPYMYLPPLPGALDDGSDEAARPPRSQARPEASCGDPRRR